MPSIFVDLATTLGSLPTSAKMRAEIIAATTCNTFMLVHLHLCGRLERWRICDRQPVVRNESVATIVRWNRSVNTPFGRLFCSCAVNAKASSMPEVGLLR